MRLGVGGEVDQLIQERERPLVPIGGHDRGARGVNRVNVGPL
jgi:hypothetical protein